jgi:hypothetical protein
MLARRRGVVGALRRLLAEERRARAAPPLAIGSVRGGRENRVIAL